MTPVDHAASAQAATKPAMKGPLGFDSEFRDALLIDLVTDLRTWTSTLRAPAAKIKPEDAMIRASGFKGACFSLELNSLARILGELESVFSTLSIKKAEESQPLSESVASFLTALTEEVGKFEQRLEVSPPQAKMSA
ncbi:MAG TPA: hypothetical protein VKC60_13995, partial [Opitutaceae bacterium]|nr:hypothetical protein [Opitutaceae bacterium]